MPLTNLPDPEIGGGTGSSDFPPFLTANDIGKGATLKAVGNVRESNSQFGEGIVLDVQLGKKTFSFTIKFSSGNYGRLFAMFGKNPAKWKGKSFKVASGEYMNKKYVKIV